MKLREGETECHHHIEVHLHITVLVIHTQAIEARVIHIQVIEVQAIVADQALDHILQLIDSLERE